MAVASVTRQWNELEYSAHFALNHEMCALGVFALNGNRNLLYAFRLSSFRYRGTLAMPKAYNL